MKNILLGNRIVRIGFSKEIVNGFGVITGYRNRGMIKISEMSKISRFEVRTKAKCSRINILSHWGKCLTDVKRTKNSAN